METSKIILIVDYLTMLIFIVLTLIFADRIDLTALDIAWAGQIGISTGFYYWKARHENRVKVPIKIVENMPADILDKVDITQIITTVIQSE